MIQSATNGYGVAFAADNRTMQDKDWQYRSDKPKLTIEPDQKPSHLQVLDNFAAGTAYAIASGDNKTETLFRMEHKLPFAPMFLAYFYVKDAPAVRASDIGLYWQTNGLMRYNGALWFEELYAQVDSKYFYIKHHASYPNPGSADTTYGSTFKFRIRFEIIAREALFLGGPSFT